MGIKSFAVNKFETGWYKQWTQGPGIRVPMGTRFHNTLLHM